MKTATKKLHAKFVELKREYRALEGKLEAVGEQLLNAMTKEEIESIETEDKSVEVVIAVRVNTIYSDSIKEKMKRMRVFAEKKGEVTYSTTKYLTTRFKTE